MYVILTSKFGEFRTDGGPGIEPVETYDYDFGGRPRARFVIARLERDSRIRIEDETPPPAVNHIPTKFLPKYESIEFARAELEQLVRHGGEAMASIRRVA